MICLLIELTNILNIFFFSTFLPPKYFVEVGILSKNAENIVAVATVICNDNIVYN